MTSPEEQVDIDATKQKVRQIYDSTMDMCKEYSRMDAMSLLHCGHRSDPGEGLKLEDLQNRAIAKTVRQALKDVEKLWKDHVKKWPDER